MRIDCSMLVQQGPRNILHIIRPKQEYKGYDTYMTNKDMFEKQHITD